MGRVLGESEAIASNTNSCGTGLRRLTTKRVSSSGAVSRRDFGVRVFDMTCRNLVPLTQNCI